MLPGRQVGIIKYFIFFLAILYRLKLNNAVTTIPTVGFNVETVSYDNIRFNVWVRCKWPVKYFLLRMLEVKKKSVPYGDTISPEHRA